MRRKNIEYHHIEQVSHNSAVNSSYKITIPVTAVDIVFNQSFWPPGVRCQWWRDRSHMDTNNDSTNYNSMNGNNRYNNNSRGFWDFS